MDVIIYQSGLSPCLRYCVQSLRVHSARSRIIVLGDTSPQTPDVEFVDEAPFLDTYRKFESIYEHHSPNPPEFELRCLRRWMVIADYVRTTEMQEYVCFDSDVLCFCDLTDTLKSEEPFSFYASHPSFAWVRERRGMEELVATIFRVYGNKEGETWKGMLAEVESYRKASISDMTMIANYMSSQSSRRLGLTSPHGRSEVFDRNICETNDFLACGDRKRMFFLDGYPYALTAHRHIVKMNTVHCWGPYKARMDAVWQLARFSTSRPDPVPWK